MLDSHIKPFTDPFMQIIGKRLTHLKISANMITLSGFMFGLIAMIMIISHHYHMAAVCIALNRLLDGIDGAIARQTTTTDFGGFLDIVCDFIIYSGVIFAFGVADHNHTLYASFLIFSFIGPMTSFLAYAIIASKRKSVSERLGKKSFYYLDGLCEGTETIIVLLLCCFIPHYFSIICIVFGVLCWITTIGRIYNAWSDFDS